MKYLLSAAVLAFSAIVGSLAAIPPPPLDCNILTPVKGDVWEMGKPQTVTWGCKTVGPLENQPGQLLMHIELGTGTPANFLYTDTIDAGARLRETKFTFILLTKYTPGANYIIRLRSKTRGDAEPITADEANKLKWSYSPNIKLVGAGGAAGQVTTGNNSTTNNTTTTGGSGGSSTGGSSTGGSSTGGSSTGGSSTGGSSTGGSSTGNSSTGGSANTTKNGKSTAGIVSVNVGVFFTTVMATFVAAAFL